jgi:type IV secretory pathway TraG/TraD family ATPase VirD4
VIKDNMDSQVYYRPTDLSTAEYLEKRLGKVSGYAQSATLNPEGQERSTGRSEQAIPLHTAQELMQLTDETIIAFHRRLPPIKADRVDWRSNSQLEIRRQIATPILSALPAVDEYIASPVVAATSEPGYIE